MQKAPEILKEELDQELQSILQFWINHTIDLTNGGFFACLNNNNIQGTGCTKGIVLNARILWTFSAANNHYNNKNLLAYAKRAFEYILDYFRDKDFGGVYWSVDEKGYLLDGRKQIYALAFSIYGMSEYYAASKDSAAVDFAIELYQLIELHSYDPVFKGYLEAFSREWAPITDLRLSAKDRNEKKTMNTHLHIIEAYANLFKCWPDEELKNKIEELLFLFDTHFIDHETHHLRLFFDEKWNERPDVISFGHDIEAAWLLLQCAETIQTEKWIIKFKLHAVAIANAAISGLDTDGGLWYEYDLKKQELNKEKHWWPQAEAMIGFFNAYELTGTSAYLEHCINSWAFIKNHIIDTKYGEWFWGINEDGSVMEREDKVGFWKCPYHNSRACIELINRISSIKTLL